MPKNNKSLEKKDKTNLKKSTQVPYQFYGYSLQQTVLLLRLLDIGDNEIVSIEVFEDVGTESANGKVAVQVKSAQNHNPVSNHAKDLWKTLSNWVDSINSGFIIPENTKFEIYCSKLKESDIALKLSSAADELTANSAYEYAKSIVLNPKIELAEDLKPYVHNFFSTDKQTAINLICKFELICCSSTPQEELYEKLKSKLLGEDIINDVCIWANGWVKKNIDCLLEKGKTPCINKSYFMSQLIAYVKKINTNCILMGCAKEPKSDDVQKELTEFRTYIKQLNIIECSDEDKFHAISDFLRASADRTMWGTKGIVHESSFDEFENGLERFWKNTKKVVLIKNKQYSDEEKGQLIYAECQNHDLKLQSMSVPEYFVPGSYHALSEDKTIGWHPDYQNKLTELVKKGEKNEYVE